LPSSGVVTDLGELLAALDLDMDLAPGTPSATASAAAAAAFRLRVPHSFLARIHPGDPADPLLRQILPVAAELDPAPGFVLDPVGDAQALHRPGLLRKYRGRALLLASGACAVHCRYCFRRHFPYGEQGLAKSAHAEALAALAADPGIEEVILSGGDPLVLPTATLAALLQDLAALPHLKRLRIHSRVPVVAPERLDSDLLDALTATRLRPVVVIHANHPQELEGEAVAAALAGLHQRRLPLLNQSVLLRGVNDCAATLAGLSEALFDHGVLPYYLHLLDRVAGAAHFEVPEAEARALHTELRARLPGYLVPRLVREVAGAPAKVPVG
jgi:EF-P beta-lysylation protein EpmB